MSINPVMLKLQSNLKLTQEPNIEFPQLDSPTQNTASFADHMVEAVQSVAVEGHAVEALSESTNDASELAVAMDQFLVELSALKALKDEMQKAIDRVFQESRA